MLRVLHSHTKNSHAPRWIRLDGTSQSHTISELESVPLGYTTARTKQYTQHDSSLLRIPNLVSRCLPQMAPCAEFPCRELTHPQIQIQCAHHCLHHPTSTTSSSRHPDVVNCIHHDHIQDPDARSGDLMRRSRIRYVQHRLHPRRHLWRKPCFYTHCTARAYPGYAVSNSRLLCVLPQMPHRESLYLYPVSTRWWECVLANTGLCTWEVELLPIFKFLCTARDSHTILRRFPENISPISTSSIYNVCWKPNPNHCAILGSGH